MIILGTPEGSLDTGMSFLSSHLSRTFLNLGCHNVPSVFVPAFYLPIGCGRDAVPNYQYEHWKHSRVSTNHSSCTLFDRISSQGMRRTPAQQKTRQYRWKTRVGD